MLELLDYMQGGNWGETLKLSWDEKTQTFSATLRWKDNLGRQNEIARKIWPASGMMEALNWMAEQAKRGDSKYQI